MDTPPARQLERDLALNLETDNDAEQRGAFNKGGEDEGRRLNATGRFRLTCHTLDGRTTNLTDADTGADHRSTRSDTSTNHGQTASIGRSGGGALQQTHDFDHDTLRTICVNVARSARNRAARRRTIGGSTGVTGRSTGYNQQEREQRSP